MGQAISLPFKLASTTLTFYRGLFHYLLGAGRNKPYPDSVPSYLRPPEGGAAAPTTTVSSSSWTVPSFTRTPLFYQHARVHLFSMASAFYLYNKPHYRKSSYGQDVVDNLANVAIPGTGLPLSLFVWNRPLAFGLVCAASPIAAGISAFHLWLRTRGRSSISEEYAIRLLAPDDWFSYWRLNCNVAGMHALLNDVPPGYEVRMMRLGGAPSAILSFSFLPTQVRFTPFHYYLHALGAAAYRRWRTSGRSSRRGRSAVCP